MPRAVKIVCAKKSIKAKWTSQSSSPRWSSRRRQLRLGSWQTSGHTCTHVCVHEREMNEKVSFKHTWEHGAHVLLHLAFCSHGRCHRCCSLAANIAAPHPLLWLWQRLSTAAGQPQLPVSREAVPVPMCLCLAWEGRACRRLTEWWLLPEGPRGCTEHRPSVWLSLPSSTQDGSSHWTPWCP